MDSSKYVLDYKTGEYHRSLLLTKYINPMFSLRGSLLKLMHPDKFERGLHSWLMNPERPSDGRVKCHLRSSIGELYLKISTKHMNPDDFLEYEKDSYFIFYEVTEGNPPTGRFGQDPVRVGDVVARYHYIRGGEGNENRITFPNYPLGKITYLFIGEHRNEFVPSDLVDGLTRVYEVLTLKLARKN
jgi:hypothetical protein